MGGYRLGAVEQCAKVEDSTKAVKVTIVPMRIVSFEPPRPSTTHSGRRRIVALVLIVIAILVSGSEVAMLYVQQSSPSPVTISTLLTKGASSYYAYGSSMLSEFNLTSPRSVLSGSFTTNASVALYVISDLDYQLDLKLSPGTLTPSQWYYASGDVRNANISLSLYGGAWYLLFAFVNDTGRTLHSSNGTSIVSETRLNITRTFTATPEDAKAANTAYPLGATYLDLNGSPGSYANGTLAVNMSSPGYLRFEIYSESFGTGNGNDSRAQPSRAVVPSGVAFDNGQWRPYHLFIEFAVTPDWNGSHVGQEPDTGPQPFNTGAFPTRVIFAPKFEIPGGTPPGQYQIILTVSCYPLDLEGTPGYGGPASIATFSISLTVS